MKTFKNLLAVVVLITLSVFIIPKYSKQISTSFDRWINFSFCDRPIKYKIGSIDSQFEITKEDFAKAIFEASEIWNKFYGKQLFVADEAGELEVNLVYDGRQKLVTNINNLGAELEKQKAQLDNQSAVYEQERAKLEKEVEELNKQIEYWNSQGGAPEKEYNELNEKQKQIQDRIAVLNENVKKINNEVEKINAKVATLNNNVGNFNSVLQVNPEVGVYTSGVNKIEIFFFGNHRELVHVLAHEMGHALGLAHVEEANSIMNPTTSNLLVLTESDKKELIQICTNKNRIDLIKNDLVNYIYSFITKHNTKD